MLKHTWSLAGSPTAKFCLPISGQKSLYTCGECGLSLPQIVLTVFTPCLIILIFPSDGRCDDWGQLKALLGSWLWSGGIRNPLPDICKLEKLEHSYFTLIIQQVPWREIQWTPWGKQAGRYSSGLQGKAEYWLGFWLVFVWIQCLLNKINTPIQGILEGSIIC